MKTENKNFTRQLLRELARFVQPLVEASHSDFPLEALEELLYDADVRSTPIPLPQLLAEIDQVSEAITVFQDPNIEPEFDLTDLKDLEAIKTIPKFIKTLRKWGEEIPPKIFSYLIVRYLRLYQKTLYDFLTLLGGIIDENAEKESDEQFNEENQTPYVDWTAIKQIFSDPNANFHDRYGWGTEQCRSYLFIQRLVRCGVDLGLFAYFQDFDPPQYKFELFQAYGGLEHPFQGRIPFFTAKQESGFSEVGVALVPVPSRDHFMPGIAVIPFVDGEVKNRSELSKEWILTFYSQGASAGLVALIWRPQGLVIEGLTEEIHTNNFQMRLGIKKQGGSNEAVSIWNEPDWGFLRVGSVGAEVIWEIENGIANGQITLPILDGHLHLEMNKGNDFLRKIFPDKGLETKFDLTPGVGLRDGLFLEGSGGFDISRPVNIQLGPVRIFSAYFGLQFLDITKGNIRFGCSTSVSLGAVRVTIERIGLQLNYVFDGDGKGNLGIFNISPNFLPPSGVGLTVKAAGVTGGGYLSFDKANHLYSGALQLQFAKVGLDAIGFITTGGPEGFSLVININTRFTPPVQLSFGFMLVAVGGLIAINRTLSVEALQAGMLDGTLDSLLFPPNPVAQAPRIIQDLQRVLPAQDGRYVVGPMLRLTWGAKSLVKIDLGLFFEFPNPLRMLLAGQLDVAVPHEDKALIKFHAAILGLLDLGRKVLAIDTRIKEGSHIVGFKVLGDTALRLSWGEKPYFLLSMGGFHPKFPVPAVYPPLPQPFHRLSLVFDELKFFHLSCESYFAITSNSLQFGANANLYVKLTKRLKVEGYLGYDTLIMFSPFFFEVGIRAGVAVKWKKRTLMGVALEFTLSGPRPWRAKGKGKIKILFFKISIGFDVTWGKKDPVLLDAISPMAVLQQALEEPASWGSQLPPHHLMGEALDPFERLLVAAPPDGGSPETPAPSLIMHPAGTLEIRQKVVPLGIRLDTLQNAPVTKANRVVIDHVTVGDHVFQDPDLATSDTSNPVFMPVEEHFAPCQFVACPPDARLTKPAFELMDAGVSITSGAVAYATPPGTFNEAASLEYESLVIDEDLTTVPGTAQRARVMPRGVGKGQWLGNVAVSRARRTLRPFQLTGEAAVKQRVRLAPPAYQVLEYVEATGTVQPMQAEALRPYRAGRLRTMTRLEADQVVSAIHQQHPDRKGRYAVLPETEVVL